MNTNIDFMSDEVRELSERFKNAFGYYFGTFGGQYGETFEDLKRIVEESISKGIDMFEVYYPDDGIKEL